MSFNNLRKKPKTFDELIKAAEQFDQRYLEFTVHALEVHQPEERDELVKKFLSKRATDEFCLANPHSKRLFLGELLQSMLRHAPRLGRRDPSHDDLREACALVTIVHRDWARADCDAEFDIKTAKRKIRNALAGTGFIARFEAEMYKNEFWERSGRRGKLISFHCHAIVWSSSRSGLRRLQRKIQGRFTPILSKKRGVHMKDIDDQSELAASLVYISKLPSKGKRTVPNGSRKTQAPCRISLRTRLHLFNEMKKHKIFDYWLAGGAGARILSEAKSATLRQSRKVNRTLAMRVRRRKPMYRRAA